MGDWDVSQMLGLDKSFVAGGNLGLAPFPAVSGGAGNPADLAGNTASYVSIASAASPAQKTAAQAFMQDVLASAAYAKATVGAGEVPVIKGATDLFAGQQLSSMTRPSTARSSRRRASSTPGTRRCRRRRRRRCWLTWPRSSSCR